MSESITQTNPEPQASAEVNDAIAETFRHNAEMLNTRVNPVAMLAAGEGQSVEGKQCFGVEISLHVDSTTGRIVDIKSVEEEQRETTRRGSIITRDGEGNIDSFLMLEPELPEGIVRVPATTLSAMPDFSGERSDGKVRVNRPDSWVRNEQIMVNPAADGSSIVEERIPDPIERGIFLQSIERHNAEPQPAEISSS
ncbi:MAG TPA: hypothetical protein VF401_02295 [Candidatus Saccharimonadales bacterium]